MFCRFKVAFAAFFRGARLTGLAATLLLAAADSLAQPVARHEERMRFILAPPREPIEVFGSAWTISATGLVDAGAPARLRTIIVANRIPARSVMHISSPGGNVLAAMELGRTIREAGLYTQLGQPDPAAPLEQRRESVCLSACALVFIGGQFRWASSGSPALFGVHRFYSASRALGDELSQVMSNQIVQYIREMGVDVALFSEMVSAGPQGIRLLDQRRLEALGVVNNGIGTTIWSIESAGGALYLKGERETHRGINKFMLVCENRRLLLWAIFDAESAWDEIRLMNAHSLLIDGSAHPVAWRQGTSEVRMADNGWVNIIHPIQRGLLDRIVGARTVGFAAQFAPDAPVFRGFDGMDLNPGRERLIGVRRSCGA